MDRATAEKSRNVLMVTVVRAVDLPIADRAMVYGKGSSDPYLAVSITEKSSSSQGDGDTC